MKDFYRVKATINLDAIHENVQNAKKLLKPGVKLMAVVKADGYGHGAVQVSKAIEDIADAYGVAILEEGIELRNAGIKQPILILGYTPEPLYEEMINYDICPTVFSYETAIQINSAAVKLGKNAKIHIALDTGMSRIGFMANEESADVVKQINELSNISIEGMFSHFATMDEKDKSKAYAQLDKYLNFVKLLEDRNVNIPIKHISNSAGIIECEDANLDMARDGICVYGMYPSEDVDKSRLKLTPAMEIKAFVSHVKTLPAGVDIGYGATFTTDKETRVATVPVGYADGYPRSLSNCGEVIIRGKRVRILGRICMDQFMVDVTDNPSVKVGDTVTLVGREGDEYLSIEEVANLSGSFNYEFVCDVGKRVPREYYKNGEKIAINDFFAS
ncbi:MAG: alanine racemase [Lachnospiraceae bacterium]|nr:alanine racemase [Lachnospiraceae bacterium]